MYLIVMSFFSMASRSLASSSFVRKMAYQLSGFPRTLVKGSNSGTYSSYHSNQRPTDNNNSEDQSNSLKGGIALLVCIRQAKA